jgi:hypothetical protein
MAGVPLQVVSAQLGHSDARVTQRYAHLSPGFLSDTVRAGMPRLGIVEASKVTPLRPRRKPKA